MRKNEAMEVLKYVVFAALDVLVAWTCAIGGFSKELSIAAGFYVAVRMFGRDLEVAWNGIKGNSVPAADKTQKLISLTEKESKAI